MVMSLFTGSVSIALIRHRTLDAGLVLLPVENADQVTIDPLFRLSAVALVAISHPFAGHSEISLRDVLLAP